MEKKKPAIHIVHRGLSHEEVLLLDHFRLTEGCLQHVNSGSNIPEVHKIVTVHQVALVNNLTIQANKGVGGSRLRSDRHHIHEWIWERF